MFFDKDYPWGFQKGGVAIDPMGTNFFRAPLTCLPPNSHIGSMEQSIIQYRAAENPFKNLLQQDGKPSGSLMATGSLPAPWLIDTYGHKLLSAAEPTRNHISQDIIFYGYSCRPCNAFIPITSTVLASKYVKFDKKIPLHVQRNTFFIQQKLIYWVLTPYPQVTCK